MPSKTLVSLLLLGTLAASACGGSSFAPEDGETGGAGGAGGAGGSVGGSGASGGSGGSGGSVGGSGGSGGSVGGSGGSVGGSGGSGGSVGGSGGSGGSDGGSAGSGGSLGGAAGSGGVAGGGSGGASTGGSSGVGGAAGACGVCPRVACLPAVWFTVQASEQSPGGIQNLEVDAPGLSITCSPNGGTPCQWTCQSSAFTLPQGDHSITLSADGYEPKTVTFTVGQMPSCGCCGCGCQNYFQGTVLLDGTGEDTGSCCANTDIDPMNCGQCGTVCSFQQCMNGNCLMPQL